MAVQRMTGLSSGLDIDSLVKKLMAAERAPLNKLIQKKQAIEWQKDAFRDINTQVFSLRVQAATMKMSSSYKVYNAASSDSTVVTASASSSAAAGTYKVTVKQLASAAQRTSTDVISADLKSSTDIIDFDFHGKDFKVTFNGVQKTISWGASEGVYANIDALVTGLQSKIDNMFGSNQITVDKDGSKIALRPANALLKNNIIVNAGTTNNALTQLYLSDGQKYQITLDTKLQDLVLKSGSLTFEADKLKFTINGKDFEIDKSKTLRELMNTVNSDTTADVTMSYDSSLDKMILKRDSMGADTTLDILDNGTTDFLEKIGIEAAPLSAGQNAIIDLINPNNVTFTDLQMNSNNFNLQGINFSLVQAAPLSQKTITVSQDVNTVYNNIKAFVDKYNETIDMLYTKTSEQKYNDYAPLTDEQREAMTDDQIKQWETKAKSGIVKADTVLLNIVGNIRQTMSGILTDAGTGYNMLSSIGITTGTYKEHGKLAIDEIKLRQAVTANPDAIANMFANTPSNLTGASLSGVVNLEGKDFKITLNGLERTINLTGSYDTSVTNDIANLMSNIQTKVDDAFGKGQITVSISDKKITFISTKGTTLKLNSGSIDDALVSLGFNNNDIYDSSKKGFMVRLYDNLISAGSQLTAKAGSSDTYYDASTLGQRLLDTIEDISTMQKKLNDIEDRYYTRFSAMESALQKMNAQSTWLSQQLGANTSSQ